jgi:hypothetical protein
MYYSCKFTGFPLQWMQERKGYYFTLQKRAFLLDFTHRAIGILNIESQTVSFITMELNQLRFSLILKKK